MLNLAIVSFTAPGSGDFTVPNGQGVIPKGVTVAMQSPGVVWFQATPRFDDTNVYLTASAPGLTGELEVMI